MDIVELANTVPITKLQLIEVDTKRYGTIKKIVEDGNVVKINGLEGKSIYCVWGLAEMAMVRKQYGNVVCYTLTELKIILANKLDIKSMEIINSVKKVFGCEIRSITPMGSDLGRGK